MSYIEIEKEVKTYNVYPICTEIIDGVECGGLYEPTENFIEWSNNNTKDLSDDTFSYNYKCNKLENSKVKYPHQRFKEI